MGISTFITEKKDFFQEQNLAALLLPLVTFGGFIPCQDIFHFHKKGVGCTEADPINAFLSPLENSFH